MRLSYQVRLRKGGGVIRAGTIAAATLEEAAAIAEERSGLIRQTFENALGEPEVSWALRAERVDLYLAIPAVR